ncbi:hypothetical protein [Cryobacterium sp. 10C3]|uniref:hypothetical protein n=1 Tax=Cryobacterium sp. 10C3 TaxID=3048577 RepID=UPI002AB4A3BB|nr:hypothetical protein [Cryobacterium sp. 10C3]MDY7558293.1 hypothetical protein [Cryobacterium sp. 10C3]
MRFSTSSSRVQEPSASAAATTASPAGSIRPSRLGSSMRSLFGLAQALPRFRGEK